ncbi:erythromycin esterase family protein [Flavobacterium jejuense]|uniref:Erythromycin esterase family protein n=1 Tax=Flavobacterium jejuense TaxID=1544455 RepID=A0ABX0IQG9_9FLAO|nr:erythromycin esterase family protein [Flavobacterium jejuense]NHN25943.1 erythromycin esterase family protein [Flavobacterium jejuense]
MKIDTLFKIIFFTFCLNSIAQDLPFGTELDLSQEPSNQIRNTLFIDNQLKGKSLVLLGEMNHGDGTTFKIKTSIIKYLHENLDFNFLVLENSVFNCDRFWQLLQDNEDAQSIAEDHVFKFWSQIEETKELYKYLSEQEKKGKPLKLLGIDCQFSGKENSKTFVDIVGEILGEDETSSIKFQQFAFELELIGPWLTALPQDKHQISRDKFLSLLSYYKDEVAKRVHEKSKDIWALYFENIKILLQIKWPEKEDNIDIIAARDTQMFANLKYHLENNSVNSKFIVWAASSHILRNWNSLDAEVNNKETLGEYIHKNYPTKSYAIGFTAHKGRTINVINKEIIDLVKTKRNSLEWYLRKKNSNALFIDLKEFEKHHQLSQYKTKILNMNITSKWSHNFDAVIYINEMQPSTINWD